MIDGHNVSEATTAIDISYSLKAVSGDTSSLFSAMCAHSGDFPV
jgi:hypothetical protein